MSPKMVGLRRDSGNELPDPIHSPIDSVEVLLSNSTKRLLCLNLLGVPASAEFLMNPLEEIRREGLSDLAGDVHG